jgi:hypothetical protein
MKIMVANNITKSVRRLLDASQIVRLCDGLLVEGKRTGKRLKPTVAIIPMMLRLLQKKLHPFLR